MPPGVGQSLSSKQAHLPGVMLCGRGNACLPASGPSLSEAALVTTAWRDCHRPLENLCSGSTSQLEIQSLEPLCLKFEPQFCHLFSSGLRQVS